MLIVQEGEKIVTNNRLTLTLIKTGSLTCWTEKKKKLKACLFMLNLHYN